MAKKTKKAYEAYLNDFYVDAYTVDQAAEVLEGFAADYVIRRAYHRRELGSLIRRIMPIDFSVGYNEWILKKQRL